MQYGQVATPQQTWQLFSATGQAYDVGAGQEQVLGRYDTLDQKLTVSRSQCAVQIGVDGRATLLSCGKPATGWREPGAAWTWLQNGQTMELVSGDQISLDAGDPEGAVFTCQAAGMGGIQQPMGQTQPMYVQAAYDFHTPGQGELAFSAGDIIEVTQQGQPDDWWEGSLNGQVGYFPSNFCSAPYYG